MRRAYLTTIRTIYIRTIEKSSKILKYSLSIRIKRFLLKESKIMGSIAAKKAYHKRWLKKNPEYQIFRLRRWIGKEKDPEKLALAKMHLKRFLDREKRNHEVINL